MFGSGDSDSLLISSREVDLVMVDDESIEPSLSSLLVAGFRDCNRLASLTWS